MLLGLLLTGLSGLDDVRRRWDGDLMALTTALEATDQEEVTQRIVQATDREEVTQRIVLAIGREEATQRIAREAIAEATGRQGHRPLAHGPLAVGGVVAGRPRRQAIAAEAVRVVVVGAEVDADDVSQS